MTNVWFVCRQTNNNNSIWDIFDQEYQAAKEEGRVYTSKYLAIRDAKMDTTSDLLYICSRWVDPPRGVCVAGVESYEQIWQKGKRI